MAERQVRARPWLLWPFVALWGLLAAILVVTGRAVGVLLSLSLMILGIVLIVTVVGLPIGIPLAILGLLLMIRSVF